MSTIYETEIDIQRSEIELLESSYIHEGVGDALKTFFTKIKEAISKLIHKVIDFFKRIFNKSPQPKMQFYKFSINNVQLNSCITRVGIDVLFKYTHAINICDAYATIYHEPLDTDEYVKAALQDPKNIIQKYLFDRLQISLNDTELDLSNIGKALYTKIVTPSGKIKSVKYSDLLSISQENTDTYSNDCIAVMKKINNETDTALKRASNIIEKEPNLADSDINILKQVTNNLKSVVQYLGIITTEIAKIAKMQYDQLTILKNTVPVILEIQY